MSEILRQAFVNMIHNCHILEMEWEGDVVTMRGGEIRSVMPEWFHEDPNVEQEELRVRQRVMIMLRNWIDSMYTDHDNLAQKVYDLFRDDEEIDVNLYVQGISTNRCWFKVMILKRRESRVDVQRPVTVVMLEMNSETGEEIEQEQTCKSIPEAITLALSHIEHKTTIDISATSFSE